MREHLHCCMDILYVFNPKHMYLAEHWFPRLRYIYECPPLPLGDKSQLDKICALHKQCKANKFSCAYQKCFQAAVVLGKHNV